MFVTIEVDGTIRGCRGSLTTRTPTLFEEVCDAARSAAAFDARYRPLGASELAKMKVTVTIVYRIELISSVRGLTAADGLVLKSGDKTGVVLPWEGKDPQVRLKWAYAKAKVATGTPVNLYRLVAERYRG